jgi:hypothetical protein
MATKEGCGDNHMLIEGAKGYPLSKWKGGRAHDREAALMAVGGLSILWAGRVKKWLPAALPWLLIEEKRVQGDTT